MHYIDLYGEFTTIDDGCRSVVTSRSLKHRYESLVQERERSHVASVRVGHAEGFSEGPCRPLSD